MIFSCSGFTAGAEPEVDSEIEQLIAQMSVREKIGQMVMADFRTWNEDPENEESEAVPVTGLREELRDAIARCRFGGIILFSENCQENEQTLRLVSEMQSANLEGENDVKIPLLIAVDQEGGIVSRLGQGTRWIGNMALAATSDPGNAQTVGERIGEELSLLGINTDFSPVLDVNNNPENPVIGVRSFSDDPEVVTEYGLQFLSGLKTTGTINALKHFPGHGDVSTDSHTGFPMLEKSYEELKECELIPFQAAIDAGTDMVMTAHIQYPEIETQTYSSITTGEKVYLPATLSHTILTDILREDMGFEGVIVSDALNMAAISDNFDLDDVGRMAIEAGIDMFLMPVPVTDAQSLKALEDWMDRLIQQVEEGTIEEEKINDSVRRILTLKQEHGLLEAFDFSVSEEQVKKAVEIVGGPDNHELEWKLMQNAVTMVKNDGDFLPIQAQDGDKVLILYNYASRMASAEFARLRLVEEGFLPESVSFETMTYDPENETACLEAIADADYVIAVSLVFGMEDMDPDTEDGQASGVLDRVIEEVHEEGKQILLISAYLPYDVARYPDADAILVTYGSTAMRELPEGRSTYSVNIPAAICGAFGEYSFTGALPVIIPDISPVKTVTTDDFSMDYIKFGKGENTLVILPGLSVASVLDSADAITQAYQLLADDFTIYVFDPRNPLPENESISDMAQDVAQALQALGVDEMSVFGVSMGGMIAMELAIEHPELVQKLILGSTSADVDDAHFQTIDHWIQLAKEADTEGLFLSFGEAIYPQETFEQSKELLIDAAKSVSEEDLHRFIILAESIRGFHVLEDLNRIICPVLIIGSEDDNVVGADASLQIADHLSDKTDCEIYMYDGYGHAAYDLAPDYKERLLRFLCQPQEDE